jgi:hypothetical protein
MELMSEIFVRMTPTDFEVLPQIIGYKISSFNVFSLAQILVVAYDRMMASL